MSLTPSFETVRAILMRIDPERAHKLVLSNLDRATVFGLHREWGSFPEEDPVEVMGLRFPNAVGLAAGIDVNAQCVSAFGAMGFGSVEVGTATKVAREGFPSPRLTRIDGAEGAIGGLIENMGLANAGLSQILKNMRSAQALKIRGGVVGLSIGKSPDDTGEAEADAYGDMLALAWDSPVDYIALNVSSPAYADAQDLQTPECLGELLASVAERRARLSQASEATKSKPVAIKLSVDIQGEQLENVIETAIGAGIDGVILGNATRQRPGLAGTLQAGLPGGLCGVNVRDLARKQLETAVDYAGGDIAIVSVGGIYTAEEAALRVRMGADLVQIASGFFQGGPQLVADAVEAIARERAGGR
ncbi:MAG: dihydroorotate dehydrogenase (quinone) [Duodenibacillus sp.]|nr:dihydroorotate dehydrogenase (quinone) [Duodenibacillus sp.]